MSDPAPAFVPPWWCRHRHLQTLWGPLMLRRALGLRRERFEMRDGDFVDLDWLDGASSAPLLLILHGLEGTPRSHYIGGLVRHAAAGGWRAVVLYFRSCSGESNRLARFYHGGDTGDLDEVVRALAAREPWVRIGAVGVSIGGNVLLKWLGELARDAPKQIAGAVAISVPFALAPCAQALDRGFEKLVYTASFMRTFKAKLREKARRYPGFVDLDAAMRSRTFAWYDTVVTAKLGGFADAMDYWIRASSRPWLDRVARPTLLINALDDPFVPPEALPDPAALPGWIRCEFVPHGGHVGFVEGRWPWRTSSWAERRALEFLAATMTPDRDLLAPPAGPQGRGEGAPRERSASMMGARAEAPARRRGEP